MKRMMVFLFAAALMLVPMGATAAMQSISDSEMAAVTGQAGVTLSISAPEVDIRLRSITWGDTDGFDIYNSAGYVNLAVTSVPMHVSLSDLVLSIDVGTNSGLGNTAVLLTLDAGAQIKLDAFMAAIVFDSNNAVLADYAYENGDLLGAGAYYASPATYSGILADYTAWLTAVTTLDTKVVGIVGLSGLQVDLPQATTIQISAH
jgi:hypothetical protein